jgi:hypothetical protein
MESGLLQDKIEGLQGNLVVSKLVLVRFSIITRILCNPKVNCYFHNSPCHCCWLISKLKLIYNLNSHTRGND